MMRARIKRVWRWPLLAAVFLAQSAGPLGAAETEPVLTLEATIPLEHVSGRIDHMAIDLARQRLIVAELGNNTVDVVDIPRGKVVHRIDGIKEPQGVAYLKGRDLIAAASANDGTVRFFRGDDFSRAGIVALGNDADDLRIDPRGGELLIGYGRGAVAAVDPTTLEKKTEIALPAHPEGFQSSPKDGRIYINVPDARKIVVADRRTAKTLAAWDTGDLRDNFPMAVSADGHTVYSVFRSPARLVLFGADSGSRLAAIDTCKDADDVFADGKRMYVYVSCGEGFVDVFDEQSDGLQRIGRIATSSGARTSLFVPELDRLFVAARAGLLGSHAAVLVLKPNR
jgi:DNA-binding beta-propeller fold protein YncE